MLSKKDKIIFRKGVLFFEKNALLFIISAFLFLFSYVIGIGILEDLTLIDCFKALLFFLFHSFLFSLFVILPSKADQITLSVLFQGIKEVFKKGGFVFILALVFPFFYIFTEEISLYIFSTEANILNTALILLSLPVIAFILAKISFVPQAILISGNSFLESLVSSWRKNKINNKVFWIAWFYILTLTFPLDLTWYHNVKRMNGLVIGILFFVTYLNYFYLESSPKNSE